MAKILYGVMGDARGHVNRSTIVAEDLRGKGHEVVFVGGGHVLGLRQKGYPVHEVPIPATLYKNNVVDVVGTVSNAIGIILSPVKVVRRLVGVIREFDPDLIITDYEYFTPLAGRRAGRPVVSLDHQHIVSECVYQTQPKQPLGRFLIEAPMRALFSRASQYLISSFFQLPVKDPQRAEVLPAVIRHEALMRRSSVGNHVVVYQTSPTFHRLFDALECMNTRFVVYGFGAAPRRKNLEFKEFSSECFLDDLASCRYAVINGGHNVISEALVLGKPLICFPIGNAYEQFLNAYFVQKNGYGLFSLETEPKLALFQEMEQSVERFRRTITRENHCGNTIVIERLEKLLNLGSVFNPPDGH